MALRLLRPPKEGRPGPTDCDPGRLPPPRGHRGRNRERLATASRPRPRLVAGLGGGSGAQQDTAPSPLAQGQVSEGSQGEDRDPPQTPTPLLSESPH